MTLPADSKLRLNAKPVTDAGFYSWEKKIDVVTKYMALGNFRLVSELTGVTYRTLMNWRKEDWWAELVEEIRNTRKTELNSKLSKIVDKSLEVIQDRLENGDIILNNKTGELMRKEISLKDANQVTKDLLNHQLKMEELTSKLEIQKETVTDQLKLLAAEFSKWSLASSKKTAQTIEFKDVNSAIHDEREEGLQEGSGEVYEPSGSSEEALGAEQSPTSPDERGVSP
jgi:hypothetical protein